MMTVSFYRIQSCTVLGNTSKNFTSAYFTHICSTVNIRQSAVICFQRIWQIKRFSGLTTYSLVLVHYIGTGKLRRIKRFGR